MQVFEEFLIFKYWEKVYNRNMKKYIVSDPNIMGGAPVIKGTRIPIDVILNRLKEGNSVKSIHKMYSWVSLDTLSGVIEEAIQTISSRLHAKKASQV